MFDNKVDTTKVYGATKNTVKKKYVHPEPLKYAKDHYVRKDKMGRRIGEKVKMTEERANEILDRRQASRLRNIFKD